jgi:hypothetical protein
MAQLALLFRLLSLLLVLVRLLTLLQKRLQVNARVLGDGTDFRLVATQHIEQGQQVSYT